jgi:integrase
MTYAINHKKHLNDAELLEFLKRITVNTGTRDAVLLSVLFYTGARASECLNITWSDLNKQHHSILIRGLKRSKDRTLPIPPTLFKQLRSLRAKDTRDSDRVFDICYQRLVQIWNQYRPASRPQGEERFGVHSLRHTFAIRLYKKHRDLRLVQMALGHRNINNTLVYADYVYETEELKQLVLD